MKNLTILIKPSSSSCDMKCKYCFYEDVSDRRKIKNNGLMKESVLIDIVNNIFSIPNLESLHVAFQGGEPTVIGVEFYEMATSYIETHKKGISVNYSIQSNGYSLNERWISLFKKYNFLVGISLDGFKENHDYFRLNHLNKDTFTQIMDNIRLLKQNNIEFNILTVLTQQLAKEPKKVYDFYLHEGFEYVQFIPCLPSLNEEEDEFSLTAEMFYYFYSELYRYWSNDLDLGKRMSISLFDNIISLLMRQPPSQCGFLGECQIQYVIESDGSVYPCDFYVLDEYCLGNAMTDSFELMSESIQADLFMNDGNYPKLCHQCQYEKICRGQCKRQRITFVNDDECGYKKLLDQILEKLCILLTKKSTR